MLLKHSLAITISRFSLVYKVLLFFLIVGLIFSAVAISSIYFIMEPIFQGIANMHFFEHIGEAFRSLFDGQGFNTEAFHQLGQDFDKIIEVFGENKHNVIGALCALIGFYYIGKFLISISYYPTSDVINNFMNSNSQYGFTSNLIANIKKAIAYSFVDTLISVPYMFITGLLVYGVGWLIGQFSVILSISAGLFVMLILLALKSAVLTMWLPTYVNEKIGVFKSLVTSIKENKSMILHNFGTYFMTNCIAYIFFMIVGLFTFGLGFFIAFSILNVMYLTIKMVVYYRKKELRYYIDRETIVDSKQTIKSIY